MSNKAYVYDPITREFVGVARLDRDPLGGGFLLPANATYARPELMDGKAAIYDSKTDKWTQVTDLRGIEVYNVDGGHAYVVEPLGDLPDSVTTVKPDPPVGKLIDRFKAESGEWLYRDDYTGVVVYNTSNGGAVTLTATDKVISEGYTTKQRPSDAYNWDTKKQDWVLDKAKQAELDAQANQAAFDKAKTDKAAEINAKAQSYIDHATGADQLPAFEVQSWSIQGAEAKAWHADSTAPTPTLESIAKNRGVPLDALRAGAYKKTMMYEGLVAAVTGQRQKFNDQLRAAKTLAEVESIAVVYG